MSKWKFMRFVGDDDEDVVTAWIAACRPPNLAKAVKARLDAIVAHMETCEHIAPGAYTTPLRGYPDIFEIGLQVKGAQYRPLCCHGPGDHEVTILVMAIERGDRFEPPTAPTIAQDRKALIHFDRRYVRGYYSRKA